MPSGPAATVLRSSSSFHQYSYSTTPGMPGVNDAVDGLPTSASPPNPICGAVLTRNLYSRLTPKSPDESLLRAVNVWSPPREGVYVTELPATTRSGSPSNE